MAARSAWLQEQIKLSLAAAKPSVSNAIFNTCILQSDSSCFVFYVLIKYKWISMKLCVIRFMPVNFVQPFFQKSFPSLCFTKSQILSFSMALLWRWIINNTTTFNFIFLRIFLIVIWNDLLTTQRIVELLQHLVTYTSIWSGWIDMLLKWFSGSFILTRFFLTLKVCSCIENL